MYLPAVVVVDAVSSGSLFCSFFWATMIVVVSVASGETMADVDSDAKAGSGFY